MKYCPHGYQMSDSHNLISVIWWHKLCKSALAWLQKKCIHLQHITYNEYLPTALGTRILGIYGNLPLSKGFSDSYQGDFDSRIMHEFSTAAFRIGHTELVSVVNRFSPTTKNFKVLQIIHHYYTSWAALSMFLPYNYLAWLGTLQSADRLKDLFSNVDAFREDSGVDELATGLLLTPSQRSDNNIVEDVSNIFILILSHLRVITWHFIRSRIISLTVKILGRTSSP